MANLVTYAKQVWQDAKTAITAARLNNMEKGISDCATQINKLGDSVSRCATFDEANSISFGWKRTSAGTDNVQIKVNGVIVLSLPANFPDE